MRHEAAHVVFAGSQQQAAALLQLLGELLEIARVGRAGGWTQTFFNLQISSIIPHRPGVSSKFRARLFRSLYACPHPSIIRAATVRTSSIAAGGIYLHRPRVDS